MSGFNTNNTDHLIRSQLWSTQLKEVFKHDLTGTKYVKMIEQFPDGDLINIPSIGQAEVNDYAEGQAIRYNAMATGNFQFSIDQYKSSATSITNKMKQDSYLMSELVSRFVPEQARAIAEVMETKIMSVGPDGQTASNLNTINGAPHRFVATGSNDVIIPENFAKAKFSLQKAGVPMRNLVAIVDPSVEYQLSTISNIVNVSNNPRWEGIIRDGMSTGMRFSMNVFGFDVYVSHFLKSGISETINGNSVTNGVANLFFSADQSALPIVGQIRQQPTVDSEYNKDLQQDEYVTTCRYGFELFRPENLVVIISDASQV